METDETAKFQFERNSEWILGFYVKAYNSFPEFEENLKVGYLSGQQP